MLRYLPHRTTSELGYIGTEKNHDKHNINPLVHGVLSCELRHMNISNVQGTRISTNSTSRIRFEEHSLKTERCKNKKHWPRAKLSIPQLAVVIQKSSQRYEACLSRIENKMEMKAVAIQLVAARDD